MYSLHFLLSWKICNSDPQQCFQSNPLLPKSHPSESETHLSSPVRILFRHFVLVQRILFLTFAYRGVGDAGRKGRCCGNSMSAINIFKG